MQQVLKAKAIVVPPGNQGLDWWLLGCALSLLCLGWVMVASASMMVAEQQTGQPFFYVIRHGIYLVLGAMALYVAYCVPMSLWERGGPWLLALAVLLLVLVLLPGVGRNVNGSTRWIALGPFTLQVSELVKLAFVLYLAGFIVRYQEALRATLWGFARPLLILALVAVLLMLQPDFGATVVVSATVMCMLFLAGARWLHISAAAGMVGVVLAGLVLAAPYRMARLTAFMDPWANQFDSGYQLTQALIAFGRGGWLGAGLGESVQKLFYLPEAHTDFLFAVLAEELGLVGVVLTLGLFTLFVGRVLWLGQRAIKQQQMFSGLVAYGLGLWLGGQALINVGVNCGLLPTKGLTLPFMSYGGSSLLVSCAVLGILLRIHQSVSQEAKA